MKVCLLQVTLRSNAIRMESLSEEAKYASLLNQLKTIVENSLGCFAGKSWNTHAGPQRLHAAMVEILGHGFRFLQENVSEPTLLSAERDDLK